MEPDRLSPAERLALDEMLGYLNLSSGAADVRFRKHCDELYYHLDRVLEPQGEPWREMHHLLVARAAQLSASPPTGSAFADARQAEAIIDIVFRRLFESYRRFHRDVLYHQSDRSLIQPFFVAKACEAVLSVGGPWDETDRILDEAIARLDDFIGYRPVAVLRSRPRIEPYRHEWVCPLPLYLSGVGVAHGPYHDLIAGALDILRQTDEDVLRQASFDLSLLDELALDPRAYDFDHPVNKRPNYHFGQWDPHRIDRQGRYRRFVLQGVTLEAISQRLVESNSTSSPLTADERLFEASALLAGTMLMASAVCGSGPDAYDSNTTLSTLVPTIAALRDAFYERLLARLSGPHADRLQEEATRLRQPLGAARQHLNQRLARLRAKQLEHVHLALLYARMGYPEASTRQSCVVPVSSARILCDISSQLTIGHQLADRGQIDEAVQTVATIDDLLHRGIECGALVDPWNILGFQGQFSLFPAVENSVRDHRVDVLIHVMRQVFDLSVRLVGEAAASGHVQTQDVVADRLVQLAEWWDRFASVEVAGIDHVSGHEAVESSRRLSAALAAWRAAGEAAGDIAFWRGHVESFDSPKPYTLVIKALLERRDMIASRALLMHWLGQADRVPLADGANSFHDLARQWMATITADAGPNWAVVVKFFDHLEANADVLWEVPQLSSPMVANDVRHIDDGDDSDADEVDDVYGAAYDDVTYRDTTADGVEGPTMEGGRPESDFALEGEAPRIAERLSFLVTVARLWRKAASVASRTAATSCDDALCAWFERATHNESQLMSLVDSLSAQRLPEPIGTQESMVEYDRCRLVKESLLTKVILTCGEMAAARRSLLAALGAERASRAHCEGEDSFTGLAASVLRTLMKCDASHALELFPALQARLDATPVLYAPLARRGDPRRIVMAQNTLHLLHELGRLLPRAGLIAETCRLIETAEAMERHRLGAEGSVSEFDRVFETAYVSIVETLVDAMPASVDREQQLVEVLEQLTDVLLQRWASHSKSLRLSVLEKTTNREKWQKLVDFIERYGRDIFVPRFLNIGNLRAILHQGVGIYLEQLENSGDSTWKLVAELDDKISRPCAVEMLSIAMEAVVENYSEYKDFNSTTTQSDRGDLLYVLLDFLRLKASYERYAWTIKPIHLAHEVLVRRGQVSAAELWRQTITQRTSEVADWHVRRLEELIKQYGVRLPSVMDRMHERFVRTLATDRMRALIKPAIDQARQGEATTAFEMLEQEINSSTEHPTGSGLEVPDWLATLEIEADLALTERDNPSSEAVPIDCAKLLDWSDLVSQIHALKHGD